MKRCSLFDAGDLFCQEFRQDPKDFIFWVEQIVIQILAEIGKGEEKARFCDIQADELTRFGGREHQVTTALVDVHEQLVVDVADIFSQEFQIFSRTEPQKPFHEKDAVGRFDGPVNTFRVFRYTACFQKASYPIQRKDEVKRRFLQRFSDPVDVGSD